MVQDIIEINIIAICDFGVVGKENNQTPAKMITLSPSCISADILALSTSQVPRCMW